MLYFVVYEVTLVFSVLCWLVSGVLLLELNCYLCTWLYCQTAARV